MDVNKVYQTDCIKGLKLLNSNSIDFIITDPPYNKDKDYGEGINDNKSKQEFKLFNREWLSECYRVLKEGHHLYFSCSPEQIFYFHHLSFLEGFKFRHLLIWSTNECRGHMNERTWLRSYEPIFWIQKPGKSYGLFNNYPFSALDVINISSPHVNRKGEDKKVHIAQKPLKLFETIIKKSTKENDLVLDPFIGSGVTAIACKKLNRRFIGFDLSKENIEICNERLSKVKGNIKGWI